MNSFSSCDKLASDSLSVGPPSVNSWLYSLVKYFPNNILFNTTFGPTSLVSAGFTAMPLRCIPCLLLAPFTGPTMHHQSFILIAQVPLFLLGIAFMGSNTIFCYQESNRYVVIFIDLVPGSFKMSPLF